MAKTLIRIFLDAVSRHRKPALFMRRLPDAAGGGRWESISSERSRGGSIGPQMTSWVANARANEFAAEAIASRVTPADSAA